MAQDDIRKLTASREFKVSKHLLELVPESCNFKPLLHEIDERIQPPLEIKPIEKQMNATKKVFSCKLYRIQVNNLLIVFFIIDKTIRKCENF